MTTVMNNYTYKRYLSITFLLLNLWRISTFSRAFDATGMKQMLKKNFIKAVCETRYQLNSSLLDLCKKEVTTFSYGLTGFNRGLKECQMTFRKDRWNCKTMSGKTHDFFGTVMARGSKEAAVMFAMVSAGMTEWITRQKFKGEKMKSSFNTCGNMKKYGYPQDCDIVVKESVNFASEVIDAWLKTQRKSKKEKNMDRHNAAVGSLAVTENMEKVCRCVGLSGACNAKCCYKTLQPLKVSADWLRKQYDVAQKVKPGERTKRDGTVLLLTENGADTPGKKDLIYLMDSPNYCSKDNTTGSLGTSGRLCNSTSSPSSSDNCSNMCCTRGYATHEIKQNRYCKCKFNWCCEVKCDKCEETVKINRCN